MPGATVRRQRQQIDMAELGLAGRRNRAHQRAQQRRFAGAVAADQPAHLAFVNGKRGVADDRDRPDRDIEVCDLKHGRRLPATLEPDAADQFLHARIIQRLGRCSVGDDGAVVERQHPVGEARDYLHVVLDEQHGDLASFERRHHHVHQIELLLDRNTAGRLVEQQQPRPADHRHADIEQLAHALRQRIGRRVAIAADLEQFDCRLRFDGGGTPNGLASKYCPARRPSTGAIAAAMHMFSNTVSEGNICATWNEREMPSRVISRDGLPVISLPSNQMLPLLRRQMTGDHVDEGGLAGAVGADHADGLLRRHADGDVARRHQRAKSFFQIADGEDVGMLALMISPPRAA